MATITKLTASNAYYGHSGNKEYSTASASHLYVGKSSGTSDYRSRLSFPALSSLAEIGASRIRITKLLLYIRRNESGSATTITAGCSSGSAWDAALAATASGSIANSTDDYQTVDLTALADAVTGYTSKWYLHISGTTPRTRFDSTGRAKKPYLEVTWEHVAATISGDKDSAELGADTVTFTIAPEVDGETHTLTYSIGDTEGTIAENAGDSITWTPPLSLASEITGDDTAVVEVRMTAYDSSGSVQRTEAYYQTVTVPESVKPVISTLGIAKVNALSGYLLAGRSSLTLTPVIDMTGAYGASIASLTATITGGQSIQWTSIDETSPGLFTAAQAQTGALPEGTVTVMVTATDSRGREASRASVYSAYPYSPPVITDFNVFRYESYYDEDEAETGWMPSDVGEYVAVTLMAEAASVKPSSAQLNLLQYTIVGTNAETGATVTGKTVSGAFLDEDGYAADSGRRIQIIFDMDIFPAAVSEDETWTYTVTVTDTAGGTAVQYATVAPGHAALSLSPDKWGAAVGMIATGTKASPKFEVAKAYESHFYGPAYDKNGAELVGAVSVADNISITRSIESVAGAEITLCDTRASDLPGLYIVNVWARWVSTSETGERSLTIRRKYLNASGNVSGDSYAMNLIPGSGQMPAHGAFAIIPLQAGEWITVEAFQDSGSAITMLGYYQAVRIGGV